VSLILKHPQPLRAEFFTANEKNGIILQR
jgi:hypothetical protein